jgi:disulfide bond formation protein DsbB
MVLALTQTADRAAAFFGVLTLVVNAFVVVVAILYLGSRVSERAGYWFDAVVEPLRPSALRLALGVAFVCTAGSLYFSEVEHFTPCRLCWFQRIGMYPLVPILAVAAWRRAADAKWYVLPLALGGACVSIYHYVIELYPILETGSCDPNAPCTLVYFREFGYQSLAFMALSGFLAIATLVLISRPDSFEGSSAVADRQPAREDVTT